jgi:hypothetical protein
MAKPIVATAHLNATVRKRGSNDYIFEICNDGSVPLSQVKWSSEPELPIMKDTLHRYPITNLEPGDCQTALVAFSMGEPVSGELTLEGTAPNGEIYRRKLVVSIYGA